MAMVRVRVWGQLKGEQVENEVELERSDLAEFLEDEGPLSILLQLIDWGYDVEECEA